MNWLIPSYYYNIDYKYVKCKYYGTKIILNQNIKSRNGQTKPINLDYSPHDCHEHKSFVVWNSCKIIINNKGGSN